MESSSLVGEDLEIANENENIIVLDRGVIMCVTDSWERVVDYIEQPYGE